jgi:Bacterial Ig domain
MKQQSIFKLRPVAAAGTALLAMLAAPAQAVSYTVIAERTMATMPDGFTPVAMWGYRVSAPGGDLASAQAAPITSPGAALVVPADDSTLSVSLYNRLPGVPTSLVVHGLNTAMAPVFANVTTGAACTPGVGADDAARRACRVRSFTTEAAANNAAPVVYTYANVRPGTYLYQSGTLPQIQVQMGLYGMMSKDAALAGTVYPGVAYASQSRVVFSEVDAGMHAAVDAGTFSGSTLEYHPQHLRAHVYGADNLPVQVDAGSVPQFIGTAAPHLVRLANAGLQSRVPTLSEGTWALLGEDAQPYPYAREQYTALLPAAKTMEAWLGASRSFAVFDRRMAFADSLNGSAGQLVQFSTTQVAPTELTANCPSTGTQGTLWTCTVSSATPGATLSLLSGPSGMTALASGSNLLLNWTPSNAQAQRPANLTVVNPVVVAANGSGGTTSRSFSVAVANVNDTPTAQPSSHAGGAGQRSFTVVAANGVLANDSDIDGDALSASALASTAGDTLTVNADGSFTYTLGAAVAVPAAGLTRTFTYRATDNGTPALSADSSVSLSFLPPVLQGNPDTHAFTNTTARPTQVLSVLLNDTSNTTPAFALNSIQVSRTGNPGTQQDALGANATRGSVQTPNNGTGTIAYRAPNNVNATTPFRGTDFFFYRVQNNNGTFTGWTRVDVTIN